MTDEVPAEMPADGAEASPAPEAQEPVNAEAAAEEGVEEQESQAESPTADESEVEETAGKPDPVQDRINKLTKKRREAERERDQMRREIDDLRRQIQSAPRQEEPTKTLQDFEGDEAAYQDYLIDRVEARAEDAAKRVVDRQTASDTEQRVRREYDNREREFASTVKDFHEKVYDRDLQISQDMAAEIQQLESGPEIAYYLANNPSEAEDMASMSSREMIRAMAGIESKLAAEKAALQRKVSKAPPPAKKLTGSSAASSISTNSPESDKLSDEEWFKAEEKRLAKLRRA